MSIRADAIKVAVFLTIGVLLAGLLWVTLGRLRIGPTESYSAVLSDVSGMSEDSLVRIAGVRVGQVTDLEIHDGDRVRVSFKVDSGTPLLRNTNVLVRYENLLGDRYLELADGPGSAEPLEPGATIPQTQTAPALDLDVLLGGFKPLFEGLEPAQINELASDIVATLQGRAGTVESLLARAGSLSSTLADRDQVIGELVGNLNTVLGSIDQRDQQLSSAILELQRLVSGLAGDREPIGAALQEINGLTSDLTELLLDVRPPLQGTVNELGRTATILDDNSEKLEATLAQLPVAYQHLNRAGIYGSFFNLYLCSVQVKITGPDGQPLYSPELGPNANTERCRVP